MKAILAFAILSLLVANVSAAQRSLTFISEDRKGRILIVAFRQIDDVGSGTIWDGRSGEGADTFGIPVSKEEFDSFWSAFDDPDAARFSINKKGPKDFSKVGFVTFDLKVGEDELRSYRFKRGECPPAFAATIARVYELVEKTRRGQPGATDNPGDAQ